MVSKCLLAVVDLHLSYLVLLEHLLLSNSVSFRVAFGVWLIIDNRRRFSWHIVLCVCVCVCFLMSNLFCCCYAGHPISSDNGLISRKHLLKPEFYYPLHVAIVVAYSCLKYGVFIAKLSV